MNESGPGDPGATLPEFDPAVAEWFRSRFDGPTEPQAAGWPAIRAGRDVLISAPTGSGKTLAAFLCAIDGLAREVRADALGDETRVVYVSPLKALTTDIRHNLEAPLRSILEILDRDAAADSGKSGRRPPRIRAEARTGDTPASERSRMTRRPPHILATTPESLYLLLTAARGREMLRTVRTVIVDEIHAVAGDKRGAHLALSLERLAGRVADQPVQRIGLSATVRPIEAVSRFLSPHAPGGPEIASVGHRRKMDLAVEVPGAELGAVASHEVMEDIEDRLAALIGAHETTLVFVNTRRAAERLTRALEERLGEGAVRAHHGSLAKEVRLSAERRLRAGDLKCVVATASLELGIDIGSVDLACLLGSPRSIAVGLQRVGRSGHWLGAIPKGRFFPTTRDELVECGALVRAMRVGEPDAIQVPDAPLDILAQHLAAETGATPDVHHPEDDLFAFVRGAYPYRNLDRADFDAILEMLGGGVATSRGRAGALLHRDGVNRTVRARRSARLTATVNGGAIPETAQYAVVAEPEDRVVGQVDEDFAVESMRGDVFLLGTFPWRIRRIESGRVRVEGAPGMAPTIPFWRGEAPGRTAELSSEVSRLRREVEAGSETDGARLLMDGCALDERGAEQVVAYVAAGRAALGAVPSGDTVIAERFFDESGGMQLVIHAPFGSRINRAWGLALRKRFCRSFNLELQAAATDNGVCISLTDLHSFPLESVFGFLHPDAVEPVLTQALLASPMFAARWRWNATRALAVPRWRGGGRVPPPIQRMLSDDLLAAVFPDQAACAENLAGEVRIPKHPLVDETIANCLREAVDLDGLRDVLRGIRSGSIRTLSRETPEPSPFAHEILNANPFAFLDPAPLEERRARAVRLGAALPPELAPDAVLDPEAIHRAGEDARPLVRDPDELHDALLTLVASPEVDAWSEHLAALVEAGRAVVLRASPGGTSLWVATERIALARAVWPDAIVETPADFGATDTPADHSDGRDGALAEVLRGALDCRGPATAAELASELDVPPERIEAALAILEGEGQVVRGAFRPDGAPGSEWCHRRVLARIHRLTLNRLRRESSPVSAATFLAFLARHQHAAPGARLHGPGGVREVVAQLQGFEAPAAAWEEQILPSRVEGYRRDWLDENCLSGEIVWGRIAPPSSSAPVPPSASDRDDNGNSNENAGRPLRPSRAAPIALLLRADLDDFLAVSPPPGPPLSSSARTVLETLERRGAQFFADLARTTGLLPSALEEALWELVAAGRVTADGFDNLRALMNPARRSSYGRYRRRRARYSPGRWDLLRREPPPLSDNGPDATPTPPTEPTEPDYRRLAEQLLDRWGVVFRDLLKRERLHYRWREIQLELRRMELRGEVLGGRFVSTFPGEQFASKAAVAELRRARNDDEPGPPIPIGAADPLNLSGILTPGPRTPSSSGQRLTLHRATLTPTTPPHRQPSSPPPASPQPAQPPL